jgi:hypothetical protein
MESRIVRICRAGDQLPRIVSLEDFVVDSGGPTL